MTNLGKDGQQENKNQNNGLINTIVNHNNKIKKYREQIQPYSEQLWELEPREGGGGEI